MSEKDLEVLREWLADRRQFMDHGPVDVARTDALERVLAACGDEENYSLTVVTLAQADALLKLLRNRGSARIHFWSATKLSEYKLVSLRYEGIVGHAFLTESGLSIAEDLADAEEVRERDRNDMGERMTVDELLAAQGHDPAEFRASLTVVKPEESK